MVSRADFRDEEWETVAGAPVAVIAAVIGASLSGPLAVVQEVSAAVKAFERAAEERRDNPLIADLLLTLKGRFEASWGGIIGGQDEPAGNIVELGMNRAAALELCRRAAATLDARAPGPEGAELRAWLLEIGRAVAEAAPEGGFLGIGGTPVSEDEQQALDELAAALGVSPQPL